MDPIARVAASFGAPNSDPAATTTSAKETAKLISNKNLLRTISGPMSSARSCAGRSRCRTNRIVRMRSTRKNSVRPQAKDGTAISCAISGKRSARSSVAGFITVCLFGTGSVSRTGFRSMSARRCCVSSVAVVPALRMRRHWVRVEPRRRAGIQEQSNYGGDRLMVEKRRIELPTSALRTQRSPS